MKSKLKIGLIISNQTLLKWEYTIIKALIESDYAEINLVINFSHSSPKKMSTGLWVHEKLDRLIFKHKGSFDSKIDSSEIFQGISQFNVKSDNEILNHTEDIKKLDLDVIICFDIQSPDIEQIQISKYGIWYYEVGDALQFGNFWECYREVTKNKLEFSVALKTVFGRQKPIVLFQSFLSIYPHSILVNRNNAYHYAIDIYLRILKKLYSEQENFFSRVLEENKSDTYVLNNKNYDVPNSFEAFKNILLINWRFLSSKIKFSDKSYWFLQYKIHDQLSTFPPDVSSFNKLVPSKDRFWADPFPLYNNGRYFIFFEELDFKSDKGHISFLELDEQGDVIKIEKIIERPYHMSYPFLLDWNKELYMVPETSGNKTIEVYKCTQFPNKWEFVMNLMKNISAKDTTLFYHNDLWWLFTSIKSEHGNCSELHLFYSTDFLSNEWINHPQNPIVSDVRYERGAGSIFINNGKLYRPSQDCSGTYGRAVNFNEIVTLNTEDYKEIMTSRIEPFWDNTLIGTHTFNLAENFVVVDALQRRLRIGLYNPSYQGS